MAGRRNKSTGDGNGQEFKTVAQQKKLLEDYIEHCKQGLSDECFPPCSIAAFNACAAAHPDIFPSEAIERARRERQLFWEKLGITGTLGKIRGFNASSWKSNMENKFGEKVETPPVFTKLG